MRPTSLLAVALLAIGPGACGHYSEEDPGVPGGQKDDGLSRCSGRVLSGIARTDASDAVAPQEGATWVGVPGLTVVLWHLAGSPVVSSQAVSDGKGLFEVPCFDGSAQPLLQVYWGAPAAPELAIAGGETPKSLLYQKPVVDTSFQDVWLGNSPKADLTMVVLTVDRTLQGDQIALRSTAGSRLWRFASTQVLFIDPTLKAGRYVIEYWRAPPEDEVHRARQVQAAMDAHGRVYPYCIECLQLGGTWEVEVPASGLSMSLKRPSTYASPGARLE